LADLPARKLLSDERMARLQEELELLDGLGMEFDLERVMTEQQTPVFFGSALTNFGVRLFLDAFVAYAPPPQPFSTPAGTIEPQSEAFSGFIFKIQANMNPKHRDSVAFLRITSGKFTRGLEVMHAQSGKLVRLHRPYKLFANEREVIEDAYPGDILGLPNNGEFGIGDTLAHDSGLKFALIPRFPPEHFALLHNKDIGKQKQFLKGLRQLETEGAVQVLHDINAFRREPILAVVGELQFDVVKARLESEYNVITHLERLPYTFARLLTGPEDVIKKLPARNDLLLAQDSHERLVALFTSPFYLNYFTEKFPDLKFEEIY
jgi:peptide chain release factor 3